MMANDEEWIDEERRGRDIERRRRFEETNENSIHLTQSHLHIQSGCFQEQVLL